MHLTMSPRAHLHFAGMWLIQPIFAEDFRYCGKCGIDVASSDLHYSTDCRMGQRARAVLDWS